MTHAPFERERDLLTPGWAYMQAFTVYSATSVHHTHTRTLTHAHSRRPADDALGQHMDGT